MDSIQPGNGKRDLRNDVNMKELDRIKWFELNTFSWPKNAKSRHVGLVQDPVWVCDTVCDEETWYLQELPFYKLINWDILLEYRLENEIWGSNSGIELCRAKCLNK